MSDLNRFKKKFFHPGKRTKFSIKLVKYFPLHLRHVHVAALPPRNAKYKILANYADNYDKDLVI